MKNMGYLDRGIRSAIAIGIGIAFFMGWINGLTAIILGIVAIVFLAVSVIGFCPLYPILKMNTCRKNTES